MLIQMLILTININAHEFRRDLEFLRFEGKKNIRIKSDKRSVVVLKCLLFQSANHFRISSSDLDVLKFRSRCSLCSDPKVSISKFKPETIVKFTIFFASIRQVFELQSICKLPGRTLKRRSWRGDEKSPSDVFSDCLQRKVSIRLQFVQRVSIRNFHSASLQTLKFKESPSERVR